MKTRTNIIISILLAIIVTVIIARNNAPKDSINELFDKTELTNMKGLPLDENIFKGKVIIVSYFQTWCSDCVKEQPELLKLKEKFGNQVEIMMVSDEPMDLIQRFKELFQSPLNFYHSSKHLKTDLGVKGFPTTYLYDKNGKEQLMKLEGINWYTPEIVAKIEQMLAQ